MGTAELVRWIRELEERGELWKFYKGKEWTELKEEILNEQHHECQGCLSQGKLTKADTVHHVNEVREKPELALSKYYFDTDGTKKLNLLALCKKCHNKAHNRFTGKEPLTQERW